VTAFLYTTPEAGSPQFGPVLLRSAAVNRRLEFVVASLLLLAVIVLLVFFRYDGTVPAAAAVSVDSFPAGCRRCLAACGFGWPVVSQFEYTLDRTDRQTDEQADTRPLLYDKTSVITVRDQI